VTYHVYKPTLQKVFETVFCNVNTFAALTLEKDEKISAFKCGDVGRGIISRQFV
jgi:transcription elongation factor Elf1